MIEVMKGQKFNEGIPAGLPEGTSVAHKTGWLRDIYHDAGVVHTDRHPAYVLVVLTRGNKDEAGAHRIVAEIAKAVDGHVRQK